MSASLENPASWSVSQWFNTSAALSLEQFKGRVVVVGAFQMLCPGCVTHCIPQLKKLHELSHKLPLTVIGLHTVFEHHAAMQPHALEVFIDEYRMNFPVGVDAATNDNSPIPQTMAAWQLRGTPSTLLFAPNGTLCFHELGHVDDLVLGTLIGQVLPKQLPNRVKDTYENFCLRHLCATPRWAADAL